MKLRDFKELTADEQCQILWADGVLIDGCMEGEIKKLLYAVHNFYVEVWYQNYTNKQIWILSFKQGVLLEKYLKKYPEPKIA